MLGKLDELKELSVLEMLKALEELEELEKFEGLDELGRPEGMEMLGVPEGVNESVGVTLNDPVLEDGSAEVKAIGGQSKVWTTLR
jgi:hypothetical protein